MLLLDKEMFGNDMKGSFRHIPRKFGFICVKECYEYPDAYLDKRLVGRLLSKINEKGNCLQFGGSLSPQLQLVSFLSMKS